MRPGTRDSVGDVRTRARANRALARITTAPTADEMRALMSRADGADRVVGFVQDVLMLAGGGPGACTNVALALNDARWPFRAYKPVENILPLLRGDREHPAATLRTLHRVRAVGYAAHAAAGLAAWTLAASSVSRRRAAEGPAARTLRAVANAAWAAAATAGALATLPELTRALRKCARGDGDGDIPGDGDGDGDGDVSGDIDGDGDGDVSGMSEGTCPNPSERATRLAVDFGSGAAQAAVALALLGVVPARGGTSRALGVTMSLFGVWQAMLVVDSSASADRRRGDDDARVSKKSE